METRNLKRKREEMQESIHEISWQGEWLPVELWTRVFYYMLVPVSEYAPVFSTFLKKQVEALQEHPLIAGIIEEFLQFRSGITYVDLQETWRRNKPPGYKYFQIPYWPQFHNGKDVKVVQTFANLEHSDARDAIRVGLGYGNLYFTPTHIRIDIGYILMTSKTAEGLEISVQDRTCIESYNSMLPYGLHFHVSKGDLCLFALNNPRTNPKHRFQCIRVIPVEIGPGMDGDSTYWVNVRCTISLTEIYVPSWRPYYVSRNGGGDA
jgi:hypothetical protein